MDDFGLCPVDPPGGVWDQDGRGRLTPASFKKQKGCQIAQKPKNVSTAGVKRAGQKSRVSKITGVIKKSFVRKEKHLGKLHKRSMYGNENKK